jgi:neurotransmitter:Na+ symporter, NSS family
LSFFEENNYWRERKLREQWAWRGAFIFAVIGSAVGLGNIWRFPYVTYTNGGGAFLIPYLVALLTAGIPLMILEFGVGSYFKKSAPLAYRSFNKKLEWVGWWPTLAAFAIICYYGVIMGWAGRFMVEAFTLNWGDDTLGFFLGDVLQLTDGPGIMGSISWKTFLFVAIGWVAVFLIIYKGIKGIGKVVMLTTPLPVILIIILVIRGVTLPGAVNGLNFYLKPDFAALADPQVWLAAYGQVFFSLSICMAILIAYASYLPDRSEINNNVMISAFADAGIAFLSGFAVFSTLGHMALASGVEVTDVVGSGVILAFVTIPAAINLLPGSAFFGVLFFLLLVTFAIDSQFSLVESCVSAVMDKWNLKRSTAVFAVTIPAFLIGIIFCTGSGLYWLDIVDFFVNSYGLVLIGLAQCIIIGWVFGTKKMREFVNEHSEIKLGAWWDFCIKFLTPAMLIIILVYSVVEYVKAPYEGYPAFAQIVGWGVAAFLLIGAVIFMKLRGKESVEQEKETGISSLRRERYGNFRYYHADRRSGYPLGWYCLHHNDRYAGPGL